MRISHLIIYQALLVTLGRVIYMPKCQQISLIHSFLIKTHPDFRLCDNNSLILHAGRPTTPESV